MLRYSGFVPIVGGIAAEDGPDLASERRGHVPDWTITAPQELTLDHITNVKALLMGGNIRIVGTDAAARLEISDIDRSPLTIRQRENGMLELTHGPVNAQRVLAGKLSRHRKYHATISLTVPRDCAIDVHSVLPGNTMISGLSGSVRAHAGSNSMTLANLSGPVDITNGSGKLEAMSISGPLTVHSATGDVVIADATGSVRAETNLGTLTLDARPRPGSHLQLATVGGRVYLGLPTLSDTKVHIETDFGGISSQFDDLTPIARGRLSIAKETFGVPLVDVWVKTVSGDIALLRRDGE
jgi:hypothetical protein